MLAKLDQVNRQGLNAASKAIERQAAAEGGHARGLLSLLRGRSDPREKATLRGPADRLDRAVDLLEKAAAGAPDRAGALANLSAAYYVRAQESGDPYDLLLSLDAADRAVAADGTLPEARFNRALALQALVLPRDALAAWDAYLRLDPESGWSVEANARREALRRRRGPGSWEAEQPRLERAAESGDATTVREIVDRFRQAAREHGERVLLPRWAEAHLAGETAEAERSLRMMEAIGSALAEINGERMLVDSVAVLQASGGEPRRRLAEAHLRFSEGYRFYKREESARAVNLLASAWEVFRELQSPFAAMAEFFLACSRYKLGRYASALEHLDELRPWCERRPYPSLLGHVYWMQALTLGVTGETAAATGIYESSALAFRGIGEAENARAIEALLAELFDTSGLLAKAWEQRYEALLTVDRLRDPALRYLVYVGMADAAFQQGHSDLALYFQNEVVRHAAQSESRVLQSDSRFWRAYFRYQVGDRAGALNDLALARQLVPRTEEGVDRIQADIALIEAQISPADDTAATLRRLDDTLRYYQEIGHRPMTLLALRTRARALRRAGDLEGAQADLLAAIQASEHLGDQLDREEARLAFLSRSEEVFEEMTSLQALDLARPGVAFEYADRSSTRVLPGQVGELPDEQRELLLGSQAAPLTLPEIQRWLPAGTALVQYSVLADRTLVWLVKAGEWSYFEVPISRGELQDRVARLRAFGSPGWDAASAALHELLIAPWIARAEPDDLLVFIPDETLHAVPFAALRDAGTRRFLVEDHRLAVAPSATLYVRALARETRPPGVRPRVLAVGDPAFDQSLFTDLSSLPAAEEEARAVVNLFEGSHLLTGEAATRGEFLSRVRQYDWVHFAGHAMVNPKNPLLSMLVLAPAAAGETGALTAQEIHPLDLDGTRMVVLSACETGGYIEGSAGVSVLARAFLAAGVPTVVASLWKVDDRPTAELFQAFYQEISRGGDTDPASALRQAQLRLLRSPEEALRSPSSWAAFEVIGAGTH